MRQNPDEVDPVRDLVVLGSVYRPYHRHNSLQITFVRFPGRDQRVATDRRVDHCDRLRSVGLEDAAHLPVEFVSGAAQAIIDLSSLPALADPGARDLQEHVDRPAHGKRCVLIKPGAERSVAVADPPTPVDKGVSLYLGGFYFLRDAGRVSLG